MHGLIIVKLLGEKPLYLCNKCNRYMGARLINCENDRYLILPPIDVILLRNDRYLIICKETWRSSFLDTIQETIAYIRYHGAEISSSLQARLPGVFHADAIAEKRFDRQTFLWKRNVFNSKSTYVCPSLYVASDR